MKKEKHEKIALYSALVAWVIVSLSVVASEYCSTILQLPICTLCWYQRICLYPLFILLGTLLVRCEIRFICYLLPFPALGLTVGCLQYLAQMHQLSLKNLCHSECTLTHLSIISPYITLPLLSTVACLSIFILLLFANYSAYKSV